MSIKLPPEQAKWLESEVAAGRFDSINDAVATAIADLMSAQNDDLAWAKPYVEQARASVARGDVISGDEFFKRLEKKLAKGVRPLGTTPPQKPKPVGRGV